MHRFFIPAQDISGNKIKIKNKGQVHHLRDVLRLRLKDNVSVFDDKGNEYSCLIEKLADKITLLIKDKHLRSSRGKVSITIACAIPKKAKFDDIVDKLTQLGVERIIPMETERVIVRLDKEKKLFRQKRWERIALSAAQQSQRMDLSLIDSVKNIKEVLLENRNYDLKIIPALFGRRKTLKEIFNNSTAKNILVLIGPEGDFTPEEVALAKQVGCILVSLGNFVLRVDTAAIAVVSFIRLFFCS